MSVNVFNAFSMSLESLSGIDVTGFGIVTPTGNSIFLTGPMGVDRNGRQFGNYGVTSSDYLASCSVSIVYTGEPFPIDPFLPIAIFKGKKQNDVVQVPIGDRVVVLGCAGSDTECFESIFNRILENPIAVNSTFFDPPIQGYRQLRSLIMQVQVLKA